MSKNSKQLIMHDLLQNHIWGAENRNSPNYQNCDFELMTFLYVIRHDD